MKKVIKYLFLLVIIALPVCLVHADDRTAITNVEATSNISTILNYGNEIVNPTFTITEGVQAIIDTTDGAWYRYENNQWYRRSNGFRFASGKWQYRAQIKIDGENGLLYRFNNQTKLKVDGVEWTFSYKDYLSGSDHSVGYIYSPSYTVESTGELEFFVNDKHRVYSTYLNQAAYTISVADAVEGGVEPYVFTKVSGSDWLTVSEDGTINGTPTVVGNNNDLVIRVTDSESNYKEASIPVEKTMLPPSMREVITDIEGTSNTSTIPALNGEIVDPTFTITNDAPVVFENYNGGWYKKIGDRWTKMTGTFTPGEWRYTTHVAVTGEAGELYRMTDEDTVVTIDGRDWGFVIGGYGNEYVYGVINSEEYTITDTIKSVELNGSFKAPKIGDDITDPVIWIESLNGDPYLINVADVTTAKWQYKTGDGFFDWEDATGKFEANKTYHIRLMITINSDLYDFENIANFPVTFGEYNLTQFQFNNKTLGQFIEFPELKPLKPPTVKLAANNNALTISWDRQNVASKYIIYRSLDGKKYTKLVEGNKTQYTNRNLVFGKTYYYKMKACDGTKCSGYSNIVSKKVVPNKVVLSIINAGTNNVKLGWEKVDTTGYEVYRSPDRKNWTKLATVSKNTTIVYNCTKLTANKTYYFVVRAFKTVGSTKVFGPYSTVLSTKTAPVLPTVSLTMKSINQMNLKISDTKGATKYIVQKSIDGGKTYSLVEELPTYGTLVQDELETGKTYYYRVRACNSLNRCSTWVVKSLKSTTKTPSVTLSTTSKKVKIVVNQVPGADGYEVYRATTKTGTYTLNKTLTTSNGVFEYTNTTTKGKTYYYKVRAYILVNDKKVYTPYSSIKSIVSK